MIGRASFGRPWIFKEVKHYLETGEEIPPLSSEWKLNVLRQEVEDSVKLLDERRGILHVRRHLAASPLFKGIPEVIATRVPRKFITDGLISIQQIAADGNITPLTP
jgi:tRNA-dihydrouridine synthase